MRDLFCIFIICIVFIGVPVGGIYLISLLSPLVAMALCISKMKYLILFLFLSCSDVKRYTICKEDKLARGCQEFRVICKSKETGRFVKCE